MEPSNITCKNCGNRFMGNYCNVCGEKVYQERKKHYDHFVFAIEACSFFILWGFLLLPLIMLAYRWITGERFLLSEAMSGIIILSVFMVYLAIAARRFFQFKWWYSIVYPPLLSFALICFIEFIYKFILFFISIHLAK